MSDTFSVSAARALFEAARRPEVQKAATVAAQNPVVRNAAIQAAKDKDTREQMFSFLASNNKSPQVPAPSSSSNRSGSDVAPPPPPPHRGTSGAPAVPKKQYVPSTVQFGYEDAPAAFSRGAPAPPPKVFSPAKPMPPPPPSSSSGASPYGSLLSELQSVQLSSTGGSGARPSGVAKPVRPPAPSTVTRQPARVQSVSPNEPHALVKYAFNGTQFDELTCTAGDTVLLKREVDHEWIYGTNVRTGCHGMVPFSFLEVRVPLAPRQTEHQLPNDVTLALYDYVSSTPGDLQFRAGDQIKVLERIDEQWLRGSMGGVSGIFPANYVDTSRMGHIPMAAISVSTTAGPSTVLEVLFAAFDYFSGVAGDLQLKTGDRVEVLECPDYEWVRGRVASGEVGLAPRSYLTAQLSPKKSPSGIASFATALGSINNVMTAIEDHGTTDPTHLYCSKGDKVIVTEEVDEHWYRAKLEMFKSLPAGLIPRRKLI